VVKKTVNHIVRSRHEADNQVFWSSLPDWRYNEVLRDHLNIFVLISISTYPAVALV